MYTLVFCRCSVQARLPSLLVGVSVQVRLNSSVNSLLQSSTTTHFLLDCVLNLECMAEDSRRKKNSSEFFWETVWSRFVVTFQRQSNIDLLLVPYHRYTSRRKTSSFVPLDAASCNHRGLKTLRTRRDQKAQTEPLNRTHVSFTFCQWHAARRESQDRDLVIELEGY